MEKGTGGEYRVGAVVLPGGIRVFTNAGVPSDGASGTGAGKAAKGSLCIDSTGGAWYRNSGTKASPTWVTTQV